MQLSLSTRTSSDVEEGGENMFISKKRWYALEKRLANLEKKVQNQPLEIISALQGHRNEQMSKSRFPRHQKTVKSKKLAVKKRG